MRSPHHTQNMETNKEFSKQLLESTSLKDVYIRSDEFSSPIFRSHGAIIELENGNKLYDLRPYNEKPIIGHSHPLILKSTELKATTNKDCNEVDFFSNDKFISQSELKKNAGYFNFYTSQNNIVLFEEFLQSKYYKFIDIVLVKGDRVKRIKEILTKNLVGLEIQGLKIIINEKVSQKKLNEIGIYTSSNNFKKDATLLYLPTAIFDTQLIDFCNRLKKVIEE